MGETGWVFLPDGKRWPGDWLVARLKFAIQHGAAGRSAAGDYPSNAWQAGVGSVYENVLIYNTHNEKTSIFRTKLSRFCDGIMEAAWLAALIVVPLFFDVYSSRIFEPDKIAC
jgi:hypothetical protein